MKAFAILVKGVVLAIFVVLTVFVFARAALAQSPQWVWTDTIRPMDSEDEAVVAPSDCVPSEPNCASWHTYRDGINRPIWMIVQCTSEGVTIGADGKEQYVVPQGQQLVVAFTARPCESQGTPTPPTSTETPEPTATVVPTTTVTPTPEPWATEGWQKWIRPMDGSIELEVENCEGEVDCWTWSSWDGEVSKPIWLESLCEQQGNRIEDGEVVEGINPGANYALGFTVRPCVSEETPTPLPTEEPTVTIPVDEPTPLPTEEPTPTPTQAPQPWATSGWKSIVRTMDGSVELNVQNCHGEENCWTYRADQPILMEVRCQIDGEYIDDAGVTHITGIPSGIHLVVGFTARKCPNQVFIPNLHR